MYLKIDSPHHGWNNPTFFSLIMTRTQWSSLSPRDTDRTLQGTTSLKRDAQKIRIFLLTGENLVDNLISYLNRDATYRSLNNIRVYMRKWFICMWIFWATEIQLFFSMSLLFNSIWHLVFFFVWLWAWIRIKKFPVKISYPLTFCEERGKPCGWIQGTESAACIFGQVQLVYSNKVPLSHQMNGTSAR